MRFNVAVYYVQVRCTAAADIFYCIKAYNIRQWSEPVHKNSVQRISAEWFAPRDVSSDYTNLLTWG